MPVPERRDDKTGRGSWAELDATGREARLAARLRANLARRKQQCRDRDDAPAAVTPAVPALDRDGSDA